MVESMEEVAVTAPCRKCHFSNQMSWKFCPSCGCSTAETNVGIKIFQVMIMLTAAVVVVLLGAFGACFTVAGEGGSGSLMGLVLLGLAGGGVLGIARGMRSL
jgi:hypothetical protein